MKVIVTGGAGFIGSHVVDKLVSEKIDTVVVDDFSTGRMENIERHKAIIGIRRVDLIDKEKAKQCLHDADVIIHLAAKIGGIGYFNKLPAYIISTNDMINRNIFDAAKDNCVSRIVFASSSMVFENVSHFPTREIDLKRCPPPNSAYGFQKLAGEYYCRAYKEQHNLDYVIVRPFNAVGTREHPGDYVGRAHVIPDFAQKIIKQRQLPLEMLGDGSQSRSFTDVRDIAYGFYLAATKEAALNHDFNIGSSEEIAITELAKKMWKRSKRTDKLRVDRKLSFACDVFRRVPDSTRAIEQLGWKQKYSLDESLNDYLEWYRKTI